MGNFGSASIEKEVAPQIAADFASSTAAANTALIAPRMRTMRTQRGVVFVFCFGWSCWSLGELFLFFFFGWSCWSLGEFFVFLRVCVFPFFFTRACLGLCRICGVSSEIVRCFGVGFLRGSLGCGCQNRFAIPCWLVFRAVVCFPNASMSGSLQGMWGIL